MVEYYQAIKSKYLDTCYNKHETRKYCVKSKKPDKMATLCDSIGINCPEYASL